jgi:hypothetical protein
MPILTISRGPLPAHPFCNMLKATFRILFWSSLVFIFISIWSITIGQALPYEFQNTQLHNTFYYFVFTGTPIAILLTLLGTVKKEHDAISKVLTVVLTLGLSLLSFLYLLGNLFSIGFGHGRHLMLLMRTS